MDMMWHKNKILATTKLFTKFCFRCSPRPDVWDTLLDLNSLVMVGPSNLVTYTTWDDMYIYIYIYACVCVCVCV